MPTQQEIKEQLKIVNPGLYISLEMGVTDSKTQKDLEALKNKKMEKVAYIRAVVEYCMKLTQEKKRDELLTELELWRAYERAQAKQKKEVLEAKEKAIKAQTEQFIKQVANSSIAQLEDQRTAFLKEWGELAKEANKTRAELGKTLKELKTAGDAYDTQQLQHYREVTRGELAKTRKTIDAAGNEVEIRGLNTDELEAVDLAMGNRPQMKTKALILGDSITKETEDLTIMLRAMFGRNKDGTRAFNPKTRYQNFLPIYDNSGSDPELLKKATGLGQSAKNLEEDLVEKQGKVLELNGKIIALDHIISEKYKTEADNRNTPKNGMGS